MCFRCHLIQPGVSKIPHIDISSATLLHRRQSRNCRRPEQVLWVQIYPYSCSSPQPLSQLRSNLHHRTRRGVKLWGEHGNVPCPTVERGSPRKRGSGKRPAAKTDANMTASNTSANLQSSCQVPHETVQVSRPDLRVQPHSPHYQSSSRAAIRVAPQLPRHPLWDRQVFTDFAPPLFTPQYR